ncbi:MAG: efflux RND transporter periplasmic adaptor subunit, partial [Methylocella sp.]
SLFACGAFGADDTPSVQVETVALRHQELSDTVTAYGTVATSEESMADISFPHAGQITGLHIRAGQKVHTGEPLVTITADPATLQSYEKARAALEFAKHDLARQQTLLAQRLATNAQLAAAQKMVADATVALEAERQLGNDQHTKLASAPFNGYVAQLMAAPGARLQANTAIMKLARTDQGLRIAAGLKPEDAGRIEPGMAAQITPILSAGPQPLQGTVRQISGTINPTSKLIDAWIDVTQTASLVPGTPVSVVIILSRHNGWVVPRNAVLRDDRGSYIFQVAKGHAKRVDVETGIETDQLTEISAGFDPSFKVVVLGNYELRDGMAVREASSATNP